MFPQSFEHPPSQMSSQTFIEAFRQTENLLARLEVGGDGYVDRVVQDGVVPRLLFLLDRAGEKYSPLTATAMAALNVIMSTKRSDRITAVVNAGAVPRFLRLLRSRCKDIVLSAVLALNQISGTLGGQVLNAEPDALGSLLALTSSSDSLTVSLAMSTVVDVLGSRPDEAISLDDTRRYLAIFLPLLRRDDFDSLLWTCSALGALVRDCSFEKTRELVQAGAVPVLVSLLRRAQERETSEAIVYFTLLSLARIMSGGERQRRAVLDAGVLNHLSPYIPHRTSNVERCASMLVVNAVIDGRSEVISGVFERRLVPSLLALLERCDHRDRAVLTSALKRFVLSGEERHVDRFLVQHLAPWLIDLRRVQDSSVVVTFLEGFREALVEARSRGKLRMIQRVLFECGGSHQLRPLMKHPNGYICRLAGTLVEEFLQCRESSSRTSH